MMGFEFFGGILVVLVLLLLTGIKQVPQSETYVVERFGKYRVTLQSGLHWLLPIIDRVAHRIDILERQLPEMSIEVITRDNVPLTVSVSTFYRVIRPEFTVYRIRDIDGAVRTAVTGCVRSNLGKAEFDEVQSNRDDLSTALKRELEEIAGEWGIDITRSEIVDVNVDEATPSRRSTSRSASSPASEDNEPPSKRAVSTFPFTGDKPGRGGIISAMAGMVLPIRSFWCQHPKTTPDQRLGPGPPTLVHNLGQFDCSSFG